ncbi:MAG TPA: BON domain-containing protein [Gammaproteobacteria bacterium]
MRRYWYHSPLLTAFAAAAVASAQQPQSSPAEPPQRPSTSERVGPSDPSLSLEVQARLYQELSSSNVAVLVRYGVATLDGVVRTDAERQRAQEIASQVPGVDEVVNDLVVAPPITVAAVDNAKVATDQENANIEENVTQRLRLDAALGSRDIHVVANGLTNTVTLSGSVSTEEEKERAGRIAVSAFPVGQVRNQLEVRERL